MQLVDIREDIGRMIQEVYCSSVFLGSPVVHMFYLILCPLQTGPFSYFMYARNRSTLELSISSLHWYEYLFSLCSVCPGFPMPVVPSLNSVSSKMFCISNSINEIQEKNPLKCFFIYSAYAIKKKCCERRQRKKPKCLLPFS